MLACWVAHLVLTNRNYSPMCADFRLFFSFLMSTQIYIPSLKGNQGTWGEKNTTDNFWVSSLILSKEKLTQPRKGTDKPLRQPNSFNPSKTEEIHTAPFILVPLLYVNKKCIHPFRGSLYILSFWTVPHSPSPEVLLSSNINLGGHQPCILDNFQLKQ